MAEVTTLTGKEEFIAQCVAGGKTRADCEKIWDEGHGEKTLDTKDYATLFRENEMLKIKLAQRDDALREATAIIQRINVEKDAVMDARKYELALEIEKATNGTLRHAKLMEENLDSLMQIKKGVDANRPQDFVSISQLIAKDEKKQKPMLTVGEWDPDTKKYKGGV